MTLFYIQSKRTLYFLFLKRSLFFFWLRLCTHLKVNQTINKYTHLYIKLCMVVVVSCPLFLVNPFYLTRRRCSNQLWLSSFLKKKRMKAKSKTWFIWTMIVAMTLSMFKSFMVERKKHEALKMSFPFFIFRFLIFHYPFYVRLTV